MVYKAASTEGAVILLQSADAAISLVLCDVRALGQVDGYGLAAWIDVNCRGMPVILTAGEFKPLKPLKTGWSLAGTERYLRKPYTLAAVFIGFVRRNKRLPDEASRVAQGWAQCARDYWRL